MLIVMFTTFIFAALAIVSSNADNLDGLGERISSTIHRQMEPLQNLGPKINQAVNRGLQPLYHLNAPQGFDINNNNNFERSRGRFSVFDNDYFDSLGDRINYQVQKDLAPLHNLGQQIEQSVYQGLEPVRAMELWIKMRAGVGGTTIVTHYPQDRSFIVQNHQISECSGTITENGRCQGELKPLQFNTKSDFCYFKKNFSIVNGHICIGANSVVVINGEINCKNTNNDPVLLTTIDEYKKMCRGISNRVSYKYIANPSDPAHVQIPNKNKSIKCINNEPNVCVFEEMQSF